MRWIETTRDLMDDCDPPDFPFELNDELFQLFPFHPYQQNPVTQPTAGNTSSAPSLGAEALPSQQTGFSNLGFESQSTPAEGGDIHPVHENPKSKKEKKICHRENERQRRQEMSALYRSLRSLLPLEYIKGRRSISDHLLGAANYVKHLQQKIKALSERRDELRRAPGSCSTSEQESLQRSHTETVQITQCWPGIEVTVKERQGVSLWRVLEILSEEGLSVVSCISTRVDDALLHTIKSEANCGRGVDLSKLREKLANLLT